MCQAKNQIKKRIIFLNLTNEDVLNKALVQERAKDTLRL